MSTMIQGCAVYTMDLRMMIAGFIQFVSNFIVHATTTLNVASVTLEHHYMYKRESLSTFLNQLAD